MKQLEVKIENIKRVEYKKIQQYFAEVKLWFNLLYGTAHKMSEEDFKQLYITASLVHGMPQFVENEENRISKEKEELDVKLRKKKEDFENNINELYAKIDTINTTYTKKEYDTVEACKAIEGYAFTLQEYI